MWREKSECGWTGGDVGGVKDRKCYWGDICFGSYIRL